jgi:enoyl-CoA hydratase/carnithine racemase
LEVISKITNQLIEWKETKTFPSQIILKSENPTIFSAGGDVVKNLVLSKLGGTPEEISYPLKRQFELDHKISELKKVGVKVFSLWNGVVMGQGVGYSITSDYRVACENTLLAMPEVRIGTFADVGVTYYFSRLDFQVGRHMAVLGYRLRDSRVFFSGLANCFVKSEHFADLEEEIINFGPESPILQKGMKYQEEDVEEGLEWVGYAGICQEVMTRTTHSVRGLVDVHHHLIHQLQNTNKPFIPGGFDAFQKIFTPQTFKGNKVK